MNTSYDAVYEVYTKGEAYFCVQTLSVSKKLHENIRIVSFETERNK